MMFKKIILFALVLSVSGCAEIEPVPFEPSSGHINTEEAPAPESVIPELVEQVPVLPEPSIPEQLERYTVVVNEVPVKELLFALARDAKVNVDIHPAISGVVTINAVEQTLPQILKRISNQVDMRYEYEGDNLIILQDTPFLRTYEVDYVNLSRDTSSTNAVSTQIASTSGGEAEGGGSGNTSTTDVTTESVHNFWARLVTNISAILGEESSGASGGEIPVTTTVIPNPESGILSVRATASQHKQIQLFIDQVLVNAKRQVIIQITIVEVTLSEVYQAGIDWNVLQTGAFNIASVTIAGLPDLVPAALSAFVIRSDASDNQPDNITATITLLDEFGDTKILSSPQIMVLNNHTALLKVVENIVYFEIDAETTAGALGAAPVTTFETNAETVAVGIVMSVTPQISESGEISLNVRPTISRVIEFVNDPNPSLVANPVTGIVTTIENPVPQIAVREMESVLKLNDGQIGILGGLMQDQTLDNNAGLPGVKDLGFFGNLFKSTSAQYTKTELVIFLRPSIVRNPSLDGDLQEYKKYLSRDYQPLTSTSEQGEGAL